MLPGANPLSSRAQNRHFCARVTEDAYGDVGLEVVNMGLGKRKARRFWVCALLLICLAARSAVLPGVPFYSECLPTTCWPGNEEPGNEEPGHEGPGNESRGTKAGERKPGHEEPGNEGPAGLPAAEVEEVLVYCGVVVEFGMEGGYQLVALLCRYYFSIYRGQHLYAFSYLFDVGCADEGHRENMLL